jgi:transposase
VYAVNLQVVRRYRGRHGSSRAKSDRGDAKVLAELVRTDRHNHRPVAGDSPLAEAVEVLARAHQSLIWSRQRHVNALRSALREFSRARWVAVGAQLGELEALAVLELAPTAEQGRRLTRAAVRRALLGLTGGAICRPRWWPSTTRWRHRSLRHLSQSRRPTAR